MNSSVVFKMRSPCCSISVKLVGRGATDCSFLTANDDSFFARLNQFEVAHGSFLNSLTVILGHRHFAL